MKVGIISDTHDDVENTQKAVEIFESNNVKVVIHAGDFTTPDVIREFRKLTKNGVNLFGIFGNSDLEEYKLQKEFENIDGVFLGHVGKIRIDGLKFGVYHGHDTNKKKKLINSGDFDIFIYGHTHSRDPINGVSNLVKNTIVLNPGTAHRKTTMPDAHMRYFRESSVLIFDTTLKQHQFVKLS